jgi:hypothetical protein
VKLKLYIGTLFIIFIITPLLVSGQGVILPSGIYMKLSDGTMVLNGNWVNNGNFSDDNGTLIINGTTNVKGSSANTFGNLTILSGSFLNIDPQNSITVNATLTNNAGNSGLVIQSNATGTASLLHNTDNVPATVQRCISGIAEAWHFISSPVTGQRISGSWLPSGTYSNLTGYDLYLWNEPNTCWIYKLDITSAINWNTVHPDVYFVPGRGYLYSVQAANPTKEYAGNLNNGTLTYGLTFSGADLTLKGFNLAGNPYPSAIDWYASSGWTRSSLVSNGGGYDMWIWNPAANNYGVYNSADAGGIGTNSVTRYIAPMQGYFVKTSVEGDLGMTNSIRVSQASSEWFKGEETKAIENNKLNLSVKSENGYGSDEILLRFGNIKNENGAVKLFSKVLTAPSLFMTSEGNNLSVHYFTDTGENPVVPVMFTPGINGKYTITCNFDDSKFETVMLEDRQMHFIQNLKSKNTYSFQSSTSDNANRFVLHFGPVKNISEKTDLPVKIYTDGYQLIVDLTLVSQETDVFVYDLMGRLLLQKKFQGEMQSYIDLNSETQILFVCLRNPDGSLCRKLLWSRK